MNGAFHITTVRGVPIYVHFTALFLLLFLPEQLPITMKLLLASLILLSVGLHELGHTLVSQRYGITVQDIILSPIGGVARLKSLPDNPRHEIRIALAGPYVSLVLAVLGYALAFLFLRWGWGSSFAVSSWFAGINTALLLFNLLPSFPMDGGRVLRGWLTQRKGPLEATRIASTLGKYLCAGFVIVGLLYGAFSLAIIGAFIFMAANSEYQMMRLKSVQADRMGQPVDAGFEAGPAPYATESKMPKGLLGDMLITAVDLFEETCRACKGSR